MKSELVIRNVNASDMNKAFRIMKQLRTTHTDSSFRSCVTSMYRSGYQLVGAFAKNRLYGLIGFRPVKTLARGDYIHVDDLVVDEAYRNKGIGEILIKYIYSYSKSNGYSKVFLDARPESIKFYEKNGYIYHSSPSMKVVVE